MRFSRKKQIKIVSIILIVLSIIFVISALFFVLETIYQNKFYPGVSVSGVNISKLTQPQAKKIFHAKLQELNSEGQEFFYRQQRSNLYPTTFSANDPDLVYEIITFDLEKTLEQAYSFGRDENFWLNLWEKTKLPFVNKNLVIKYDLDKTAIEKILRNEFSSLEKPEQNPQIELNNSKISLSKEKLGLTFDYQNLIQQLNTNLNILDFKPIELKLILNYPEFNKESSEFLIPDLENIFTLTPLNVSATTSNAYGQTYRLNWQISTSQLTAMLILEWNNLTQKPFITFSKEKMISFLEDKKALIEKEVRDPKFKIENERVIEFQAPRYGLNVNLEKTLDEFTKQIIDMRLSETSIVVEKVLPNQEIGTLNSLGISELIGLGQSSFAGSPRNRRHNIKVGAESINGLLLAPGEEFSMNNALGDITASKGYLPELVIKGNKTVPEYGGGLCQIATTMFRLAINSGLEITARKTHAYRVGYYEPAGTDATIYSPWPDLRFINNTQAHLLLQTYVDGDDVTFEFWGTSDGRQISISKPVIYNITSPGPTKYIETTDLAPGKISCIESAHNGADAHFIRTITWPDDSEKELLKETWESHYRPWQAVCLIGVEEIVEEGGNKESN
ncbi:VanW family protein [Patescibacteria group bacterium]